MSTNKLTDENIFLKSQIFKVRDALKLKNQAFAKALGVSPSTISLLQAGKRSVGKEFISLLQQRFNVNSDWLFTGEGSMFRGGDNAPPTNKDYIHIPLYDVRAAAGHGIFVDSEDKKDLLLFRRGFIEEELRGQLADFSLIFVDGESMSPTLRPGEIIMVDHRDQTFQRDGVYVMQMDGTLIVKTVRSLPDNQAEIISDNPAYGKFSINKNEPPPGFRVVGRVVWNGRRM